MELQLTGKFVKVVKTDVLTLKRILIIPSNLRLNICRCFHVLASFHFTTCEAERDCYHQKVKVWYSSGVVKLLKDSDLTKLGNLKKILEMLGFDG